MNTIKNILLSAFLFLNFNIVGQVPATEIRAVWLTTNWKLDWPVNAQTVTEQKVELKKILDELKSLNFNTVFFQVRAQGKVFYRSSIEPLSPYFNQSDGFDPLAYAVQECHERGFECHAWLVVYPNESIKKGKVKLPYYKAVNGIWHLDPGMPETRKLILSIVDEIVDGYDIDGIQLDYIRYPNNSRKFPDDDSYKKYGKKSDLYDWRRSNINQLVSDIYDSVKARKNWVQVSSSTLGRYQPLVNVNSNDGWTARETVFQDAAFWLKSSKHDLLFPMMYYRDNFFFPYLDDWIENSYGRIIVPGLGVYQLDPAAKDWSVEDLEKQMAYTREKKVPGQAYFRTRNILDNLKGVRNVVQQYYPYPAKLPPLTWLDNTIPDAPLNLQVYKDPNGLLNIEWDAPDSKEQFTYNIYISLKDSTNTNLPQDILAVGLHSNRYSFPINEGDFGFYYSVTASDRYHNESLPCTSAYFSHSHNEQ